MTFPKDRHIIRNIYGQPIEHPGYEEVPCRICGQMFLRARGNTRFTTCGYKNCEGKDAKDTDTKAVS